MNGATSDSMSDARAIRARLVALREAGARAFDSPAFDFAEALVTKAGALGEGAAARLLARASERLDRLADDLARTRARAERAVTGLPDDDGELARAIENGAFLAIFQRARRDALLPAEREDRHASWLARLEAEAHARGVRPRALAGANARAKVHALVNALYDSSVADASAMTTAMRAAAELPASAGPYNPLSLATRALAELAGLSPTYLAARLAHLTELGALLALPAPPSTSARPRPKARPRRRT
jgi:hypothetical protein